MPNQPLHLYFIYAPQDEELCNALDAHLKLLVRQGYISDFSSDRSGAGSLAEAEQRIDRADLIVALVSADLLASDRLYDVELRRALARPEDVLGVLLRPCDYAHGDLKTIKMEPADEGRKGGDGRALVVPLTMWSSLDDGLTRVAAQIRRRAEQRVGSLSLNPRSAHPVHAPLG